MAEQPEDSRDLSDISKLLEEFNEIAYQLIDELDSDRDTQLITNVRKRVDYWNRVMDTGSQVHFFTNKSLSQSFFLIFSNFSFLIFSILG